MEHLSLDVHVGVKEETSPCWLAQCLGSLRHAAALADYPVHIHIVPGVPGHIGKMRMHGYSLGTAPYVTYADDDDYVLPQAFVEIGKRLRDRPDAVFPAEYNLQNGIIFPGSQIHHLVTFRREWLFDQSDYTCTGDLMQVRHLQEHRTVEITTPLYVHRLYVSGGRRLRRVNQAEHLRTAQRIERFEPSLTPGERK